MKVMKKPAYYKECLISARCSDWDVQEEDEKFIAILVPANTITLQKVMGLIFPNIGRYGMQGLEQMKFLVLTG